MTIQSTMLVVTIITLLMLYKIKSLQMFNGLVKEFNCFLVLLDMYYHESNSCILHLQGTHYLFILQYHTLVSTSWYTITVNTASFTTCTGKNQLLAIPLSQQNNDSSHYVRRNVCNLPYNTDLGLLLSI